MTTRRVLDLSAGLGRADSDGFVVVAAADAIPVGGAVVVPVEPPIAIFNVQGELLATDDTCSHSKSSLGLDGFVDGDVVECAWHFAQFCLRTGDPLTPPARKPVRTHRVEVRDGLVHLQLPAHAGSPGAQSVEVR